MSHPSKRSHRALFINLALIVVAFTLLGWVIWKNRERIVNVFSRKIDARLIGLAFAIYMVGLLLTFIRWSWLVRVIDPKFRVRDAAILGFIGNVYNLVIPGAVGGDLIKAAYLVKMRINSTQAIASMVIDRILGLLGLFLLAGIAGIIAWPIADTIIHRLIAIVWVCVVIGLLALAAIFRQALTRRFPGLLTGQGRLSLILNELKTLSETYSGRLEVVVRALVLSTLIHSLNVLAFYTVSHAIFPVGLPSLAQHFLMVPLILFTTAVPLPFGALGLTEEVSEQLFALVRHPEGALAMMGFRVLMYAGALVSVLVYLANIRQVRGLTETTEQLDEQLDMQRLPGDPVPEK